MSHIHRRGDATRHHEVWPPEPLIEALMYRAALLTLAALAVFSTGCERTPVDADDTLKPIEGVNVAQVTL
ncbi:hypothetical protein [Gemmatimonas sp.]|uniref:hypothetical protein n=1 Tax=Gemmatimonas sp. TaxID=1962908 RepID=UPI0033420A68